MRVREIWPGMTGVLGLVLTSLGLVGCGAARDAPTTPQPSFPGVNLVVGVVGEEPDASGLRTTAAAQRGEWEATRGGSVTVSDTPVGPEDGLAGFDVLIFPGDHLGELVDRQALVVLPEAVVRTPRPDDDTLPTEPPATQPASPDPLDFDDVLPAYRDQVTRYGDDRLGLPYGGSALVLVYRRDAFDHEPNQDAARQEGLTLEPPRTWDDLDALAHFFHGRDWDGDGQTDAGIALALGADPEGVAEAIFLARAAALGQHRDQYSFLFDAGSMAPRIATPPFVEALAGLVALQQAGPEGLADFDAEAARQAFRTGQVALLIDRAERATRWTDPETPLPVGVAPLPGSPRVFDPQRQAWEEEASSPNRPSYLPFGGGWLVGVSASSRGRNREAALDFARYLAEPETASRVLADTAFPMLPTRMAHLGPGLLDPRDAAGVDERQWSEAVARTLTAPRVVVGLRIPDTAGYLADLVEGLRAALAGEQSPEPALEAVAQAWSARTERLGTQRQLWHYRRSLNTLATLPSPPPR